MNSEQFFVSVIIPVYNGEKYLAEAVESIHLQNYEPIEIIIVDDGSTDNTAKIATSFKDSNIHYIYQPNSGPPVARNRGIRMARGNVITFLDVDDLWSNDKLQLQLAHLRQDESVEIVLGHTQLERVTGFEKGRHKSEKWAIPTLAMSMGSASFRKSVFDKVGLFDESQSYCDDMDWFMRARELGNCILVHPEVTLYYRRHRNNMTNQIELGNHHMLRMLKKSLDRRRCQKDQPAVSLKKMSELKD
jgi:glycosyltransferase involved in cell wall biosynthesis